MEHPPPYTDWPLPWRMRAQSRAVADRALDCARTSVLRRSYTPEWPRRPGAPWATIAGLICALLAEGIFAWTLYHGH